MRISPLSTDPVYDGSSMRTHGASNPHLLLGFWLLRYHSMVDHSHVCGDTGRLKAELYSYTQCTVFNNDSGCGWFMYLCQCTFIAIIVRTLCVYEKWVAQQEGALATKYVDKSLIPRHTSWRMSPTSRPQIFTCVLCHVPICMIMYIHTQIHTYICTYIHKQINATWKNFNSLL